MSDQPDVTTMSDEDLRRNLITLDYRGREFKTRALDELLLRATGEMYSVLTECDEYLDSNKLNQIGSGSILHQKMRQSIRTRRKDSR